MLFLVAATGWRGRFDRQFIGETRIMAMLFGRPSQFEADPAFGQSE
jgi:hypothetical protein